MQDNEQLKKLGKTFLFAILGFVVAICIISSFYTVKETESVVITTFGKATLVDEKGLHFKLPIIQKAQKADTTVQGIQIGYTEDKDGKISSIEHESIMITSDFNFIDCDFYISYQVTDPIKYLYNSDNPDEIVKNIGITLVDASIQDVEPPTDNVISAFTAVETAKQGKESAVNEANAYRNEQIPAAEAKADRILQDAEATKTSRINEANGQVSRFNAEYEEYKNYPLITKQRMFLETMEDVLPELKVVIDNGNGDILKYYPISDLAGAAVNESSTEQ